MMDMMGVLDTKCLMCQDCAMLFRIWKYLLLFIDSRLELLSFTCPTNVLANPVLRAVGEIHTASNSICSGAR